MRDRDLDCRDVDEGDLEVFYVAGRLGEAEAEAFEAHYMACDRCFGLVSRALEVRAAEGLPAVEAGRRPPVGEPGWRILLAAAAVAAVALAGTWWGLVQRGADAPEIGHPDAALAVSPASSLRLTVHPHPSRLRVSWEALPGARAYHAALLTGGGLAVHEQEVTDTMVSVAVSEIVDRAEGGELYWHVDALDASGLVMAHAGPEEAGLGGRSP